MALFVYSLQISLRIKFQSAKRTYSALALCCLRVVCLGVVAIHYALSSRPTTETTGTVSIQVSTAPPDQTSDFLMFFGILTHVHLSKIIQCNQEPFESIMTTWRSFDNRKKKKPKQVLAMVLSF